MKQGMIDLFSGLSQHVSVDPASIKLLSDRVLVRDLKTEEDRKVGSLWIPETADTMKGIGKQGLLRLGVVVAVGPGDAVIELPGEKNLANYGWGDAIRRRLITGPCDVCDGDGVAFFDDPDDDGTPVECSTCAGEGRVPVVVPPQCQVGDTVLYEKRLHERIIIGDVPYFLMHSEQAILAVIE